MKRLLKYPAFNAICLSVFTAFYATLFFTVGSSVSFKSKLIYSNPVKAASLHPDYLGSCPWGCLGDWARGFRIMSGETAAIGLNDGGNAIMPLTLSPLVPDKFMQFQPDQ